MRISFFYFTFLITWSASAQETTGLDSFDLEQVLIKATRSAIQDPLSFQNITSEKIAEIYSGQDPAVLLHQLSPSIISYSDAGTDIGNYAQFRMRGISQSRINVTLNGVPLNDMIDQGVFFSNFSDFGNSIESIQINRGVSASNVGVASYGGSINFESKNVFVEDPTTSLELTMGSFGTLRTAAEISTGKLKNGIGAYGRITRTNVDGYKTHSASDSYSIFGSIGYAGSQDILKFTGFMGKTQNDQSYLPVLLSDIRNDPKINYNHPNDTDDFEQDLIQLQYSRVLSDKTSIDATAYYSGARGVFPFAVDNETQFVFGLSNNHYGVLSHINVENDKWSIKGGVQAYTFDRTNFEYLAPNVSNPYDRDHSDKVEMSTFAKINYHFNDFSIFGNIQIRNVDIELSPDQELGTGLSFQNNWLFFNWIGGINYNLNSSHALYLSYGKTSREPTRSDIRNGATLEESVKDFEIGWKLNNQDWSLNANLFHMSFRNEISQVGALMERSYMDRRQNVPESMRSGFELQLDFQPSEKWGMSFNGTYMNTNVSEFANGDQILEDVQHIFAPSWMLRPQIDFAPSDKFKFILSGRYVSSSFMELANIPSFELPAHKVVNIQLDYHFSKRFSTSIMLNNLYNELYFTDGAPIDLDFDGIVEGPGFRVQPPRHVYVVFRLRL